jgi:hypothetical protein
MLRAALEPEKMLRNTFLSRRPTSYHLLYGIRMRCRIALALFRFKFSTAVPFQHHFGREYAMALLFSIFMHHVTMNRLVARSQGYMPS